MNNRISKCFERSRAEGRAAFVAYLTIGYPSLEASEKAIDRLIAESGADIIELGVPFSDPFADGAVIRHGPCTRLAHRSISARTVSYTVRCCPRLAPFSFFHRARRYLSFRQDEKKDRGAHYAGHILRTSNLQGKYL